MLIGLLRLHDVLSCPVPGLVALGLALATLTARWRPLGGVPGASVALVGGTVVYYPLFPAGLVPPPETFPIDWALRARLSLPIAEWCTWFSTGGAGELGPNLALAFPLALPTVVGGINCVASAAAATRDVYPTARLIAGEGLSTLIGGAFSGVVQTTPYIGHPAYKDMDARAGYTLATEPVVGAAGMFGGFDPVFAAGVRFQNLPTTDQPRFRTAPVLGNEFLISRMIWAAVLYLLIEERAWPTFAAVINGALVMRPRVIYSPLPDALV